MADSIATRVTRIVSGSVHALLDAVEDAAPEAIMAQAVREVDQVIDEVRTELGRVEAAKHLVTTQLNKLNSESEHLAGQIELAMGQNREDLVRSGLEKQINIEDQVPVLQKSLAEQQERGKELEGYITALLAKKREMEQALQEFLASRAAHTSPGAQAGAKGSSRARVDNAGSAFDRVMARQTGVAGLSAAVTADAAKLKELQDLQRNHRIEERLAKLKAARQK
ncbi:MAG TPA: PspA/IM30 family protein [Burkholderiales bacterium]|nr:PspA/IM30 family protein [Burkholderiales bacterium]